MVPGFCTGISCIPWSPGLLLRVRILERKRKKEKVVDIWNSKWWCKKLETRIKKQTSRTQNIRIKNGKSPWYERKYYQNSKQMKYRKLETKIKIQNSTISIKKRCCEHSRKSSRLLVPANPVEGQHRIISHLW